MSLAAGAACSRAGVVMNITSRLLCADTLMLLCVLTFSE
jgi:hypothetical protein